MLENIVVQTDTVQVDKDQSFDVHGLTLEDIGVLINGDYEAINRLMESRTDLSAISNKYPEFMAKVVAMGAGDYENWKMVTKYPFMVQLTAFEKVWDLTIPDYAALGKLVERIKGIIPKLQEQQVSE